LLNEVKIDNFVLFAAHSDIAIDERFLSLLNHPRLIAMYSMGVQINHPKLKFIPVGIRYVSLEDLNTFVRQLNTSVVKWNNYYVRFSVGHEDRVKCLKYCKKPLSPKVSMKQYFENMAGSYFMLIPDSNSIPPGRRMDHHQIWESIYLKTIPIMIRSIITEHWQKMFPIVLLNDWSEFNPSIYNKTLYEETMSKYDLQQVENNLKFDYFLRHHCQENNNNE
jgi:hypothetical protein